MNQARTLLTSLITSGCLCWSINGLAAKQSEDGISNNTIRVGGVLDLEGQSRGLGQGMKSGIEAAFNGVTIRGKKLEYVTINDSYTPELTIKGTQKLVDSGIFAMIGNVGTPTAKVALPILAQNNVPAVGFFTGAGLLRKGSNDVINFRASYIEEAEAVINQAFDHGVEPSEICAYVQNDAYGMAGVEGIKLALSKKPKTREIIQSLNRILEMKGDNPPRNNTGPVGVYQRNTLTSREGYESLKNWETTQDTTCKIVVSVGTYNAVGRFAGYSRYKGDDWIVSAVSFTGAENVKNVLTQFGVKDRFIMTQVVPPLNKDIPIIKEARKKLGDNFGYVSLEGYIVGKMFITIMNDINGDITRENFIKSAKGNRFELGGIDLNFRRNNQGSSLVSTTYFNGQSYVNINDSIWRDLL